jgi:hypothetical protein
MIVTEKNVSDALTYLADDPHPIAKARYDLNLAETNAKRAFAIAFMEAQGSVDLRKAAAENDDAYQSARATETEAIFELARHQARVKAAENIVEVWRSENANIRAAERVR